MADSFIHIHYTQICTKNQKGNLLTMINGYRQIACRNCLARYKVPNYTSINLTAAERWSDGRRIRSLFDNGYGIRACKCGKYYRLHEAIDMGLLTAPQIQEIEVDEQGSEVYHVPAFLLRQADDSIMDSIKSDSKSLFKKIKSFVFKKNKEVKRTKKVMVQKPLGGEIVDRIPNAIIVRDSEMHEIIKNKEEYSADLVLAARERYRMHLNDKYREPFKEYCNDRTLPIPDYELSTEHQDNSQAILDNYLKAKEKDWKAIGDLYRELGDFEKAVESFELEVEKDYAKVDLERLTRACRMEISNPLPL
jgi:predicted house-cleaning noncanonical NTP pyrophosphatase (MazG superfamily)